MQPLEAQAAQRKLSGAEGPQDLGLFHTSSAINSPQAADTSRSDRSSSVDYHNEEDSHAKFTKTWLKAALALAFSTGFAVNIDEGGKSMQTIPSLLDKSKELVETLVGLKLELANAKVGTAQLKISLLA